ncbi:MAG: hypothetical protein ACI9E1_000398 [Cryomorphaceae bacterium]|jgi:hypothetical protein
MKNKPLMNALPSCLRAASTGLILAVITLLFCQGLGIVFGLNEDSIKSRLNADAAEVLGTIYKGDKVASKAVVDKSLVYMQRAHLHAVDLCLLRSQSSSWFSHGCWQTVGMKHGHE